MFIDFDIAFLLSSLLVISFVFAYLFNSIGNLKESFIDIFKITKPIYIVRYVILNNLYTNDYDPYNKYFIWRYCVEF